MSSARKKKLKVVQDELSLRRDKLLTEIENRLRESRSDSDSQLTDMADIATHNLQDELSMMVAGEEIKKVKQIDNALARIESNKYGICVSCSCEINIERLKALPFATMCVKCKEKEEKEVYLKDEGYSYGREIEFDYDLETDDDRDIESKLNEDDLHKNLK